MTYKEMMEEAEYFADMGLEKNDDEGSLNDMLLKSTTLIVGNLWRATAQVCKRLERLSPQPPICPHCDMILREG